MKQVIPELKLAVATILVIFLLASSPKAEEPALRGQIISPTGQAIQGFPVIIDSDEGSFVTTTDESGHFSVHQLPTGDYSIAPANEPHLKMDFKIRKIYPKWYEVWKKSVIEPVDIGKIELEVSKKY